MDKRPRLGVPPTPTSTQGAKPSAKLKTAPTATAQTSKPKPKQKPPAAYNPTPTAPDNTAAVPTEKQSKFRQDSEVVKYSDKLRREPKPGESAASDEAPSKTPPPTSGQVDPKLQGKGKDGQQPQSQEYSDIKDAPPLKPQSQEYSNANDTPPLKPQSQSQAQENARPTKEEKTALKQEKSAVKENLQIEKSKLRFEKSTDKLDNAREKLAKQKPYKRHGLIRRAAQTVKYEVIAQAHRKVREVEGENVGVEAAHKAEIQAERGGRMAVRHIKHRIRSRPARRVRKLTNKNIKAQSKLRFQQLAKENPALKSNALKRLWHKKRIQRQFRKQAQKQARKAAQKVAVKATLKTAAIVGKVIKPVLLLAKNPKVLLILGICLLLIFIIQACTALTVSIFNSMGGAVIGGTSYLAESEEITEASLSYSEWEIDLLLEAQNAESSHPGYDEYRFNIDPVGHCPFALIAYLTVKYNDFTFAQVEATMRDVFNQQYSLTFDPSMEIRTRIEERTGSGSWTDDEGNTHSYTYTYTVIVEYEWWILTVTLTAQDFESVIRSRLTAQTTQEAQDELERFELLMITRGNRQYVGNPFDFYWVPHVSSKFGYRIHPISGDRSFHTGIDIALPEGTPILAGGSGVVTQSGWNGGYGYSITIYYGNGISALYAHCSVLFFTVGQEVEPGDVIAHVGSTGDSTGPHLHMEVMKNGQFLNPIFFVMGNVDFSAFE